MAPSSGILLMSALHPVKFTPVKELEKKDDSETGGYSTKRRKLEDSTVTYYFWVIEFSDTPLKPEERMKYYDLLKGWASKGADILHFPLCSIKEDLALMNN
jgi:hypothetical protein